MVHALDGSKDDFVGRWIVQALLVALRMLNCFALIAGVGV